jgi:hypothetical protein
MISASKPRAGKAKAKILDQSSMKYTANAENTKCPADFPVYMRIKNV